MNRLSTLLASLLTATALAVAAGCGGGTDGDGAAVGADGSVDLSKVTLRVGDQKGGQRALLGAAGELDGVKYRIEWKQFTSGPPLLEAVNAGALDVGAVGNTPPVFAAAAGSKIKIIAAADIGLTGQAVLVPKDSPIRTPAELEGKRIAVAKGSSSHYHLLTVLKRAGLTFADIQPQYLAPPDALAALSSGKIDAWAIWDPYTAQGEAQAGARILVDARGYTTGYQAIVAADRALSDKAKAAALRDYLARQRRALLWANDHVKEWGAVWAKDTGLPVAIAEKAAERRAARLIQVDDTLVRNEQQIADAFADQKLIPGRVEMADFVDRRFNDIDIQAK
ncbi:ABC transporter substrate-binding protein [Actinomadura sp. NBRC 104425]|uniref:ABC transporter substrate-binding protein n=1 Tax=Actinomadura sp. NBRC 104425 TaxID=3032204 RepID=UPI0024A26A29|nr:ABC transporter substrate-binding protein [Actinomadura sp. NBRC 104425]GLZ10868.1 ABC transporter substrate-binding protein [Actinomadura sp. NBRC 104425]